MLFRSGLLAYGAKDAKGKTVVERVDKIVGPGNVFAAIAKKEVFGVVDIDMVAGPSEVLVMADNTCDPDFVAADLLSQAEHGSGFEAAICITDNMETAQLISACVDVQVENSPKRELLEKVLGNFGRILVVKDWFDGVEIANRIAPEHLEVMTAEAESMASFCTIARPSNASTRVTSALRFATMLVGCRSLTISGTASRSRTTT